VFYAVLAGFVALCVATGPLQVEILASVPLGRALAIAKGYLTLDLRKYAHPLLSVAMPVLFLAMGALPQPGGAVRSRSTIESLLAYPARHPDGAHRAQPAAPAGARRYGLDFVWDAGFTVGGWLGADGFLVELGASVASLR
jgi:hypothetical protein